MRGVWLGFAGLAGIGLLLALAVHVASIAGTPLFGGSVFVLHAGVFVVWLPAVVSAQRYAGNVRRKDVWKVILRGCPGWMKGLALGFFAYAFVNFAYFFVTIAGAGSKHSAPPEAAIVRGFSGHWMAFYAVAMAILYSSSRVDD